MQSDHLSESDASFLTRRHEVEKKKLLQLGGERHMFGHVVSDQVRDAALEVRLQIIVL